MLLQEPLGTACHHQASPSHRSPQCPAFQSHRQMVGGALAQTECLSAETPTDVWAPATYQRPRSSGHLKRSPGPPSEPQVQGKGLKSKAPLSSRQPQKVTKTVGPPTGPLTPTQLPSEDTGQLDFRTLSPEVPASGVERAMPSSSRTFWGHSEEAL